MDSTDSTVLTDTNLKSNWQRRTAPGADPGTIQVDPNAPAPEIHVLAYGPEGYFEDKNLTDLEALQSYVGEWPVLWVNVEGLGDADIIRRLGEIFCLHRLALEDVVNVHQRAKVEEYAHQLFIVVRMVYVAEQVASEQLSIFLGDNYLITFQSRTGGDCLAPVRDRIRRGIGRIRQAGADYLAYSAIDAVIDAYFPVLDIYSNELEDLEDEVIEAPTPDCVSRLHRVKRNLLMLRRVVWPLREAVNALIRESSTRISHDTQVYLRDCYDHTAQILDLLESYREIASGLMDAYLSSVSHRMNEIMKVLTIISTIFIPLSFFAGLYGMNFDHMPELHWRAAYPGLLLFMALVAGGMLAFFWRKGWIGNRDYLPRRASTPAAEGTFEPQTIVNRGQKQ